MHAPQTRDVSNEARLAYAVVSGIAATLGLDGNRRILVPNGGRGVVVVQAVLDTFNASLTTQVCVC